MCKVQIRLHTMWICQSKLTKLRSNSSANGITYNRDDLWEHEYCKLGFRIS